MSRPSARTSKAGANAPAKTADRVEWRRLAAGAGLGALALLLAGVLPLAWAWAVRGLVCGLVVGLSVRSVKDVLPAAFLSAAAGAFAMACFALSPAARALAPPQAGDVIALLAVCSTATAAVGWVCARGRVRVAVLVAMVVLVGLQLYQSGVLPGTPRDATASVRERVASEPVAEAYQFDGDLFIKVDHLMSQGVPYYEAFLRAFDEDARLQGPPPGLFSIRQRWVFELWNVLPGPPGLRVLWWFDALAVATMLAGYAVARRFVEPAAALVAPIAIGGYLLTPAVTLWFTLSEYWGGMVVVFFLYAMVTERWTWGAVLAVVAIAFRELFLFLVPVYIVWWLLSPRKREGMGGLVLAIVAPVTLIALHVAWSPVSTQSAAGAARWFQGGAQRLIDALQFSGDLVGASDRIYLAIPLLALAGALATRARWTKALLGAMVAVPVVALTVFSGGEFNYYWGAIAMPAFLALVPLVAGWLLPSESSRLDGPASARPTAGGANVVRWSAGAPMKVARGGAVLFAEKGLAVEPATLAAMEAEYAAGADVVVASRLVPGARAGGGLPQRVGRAAVLRAFSAAWRCLVPVPGLTDPTSPVVLVSGECLRHLPVDIRSRLAKEGAPASEALVLLREHARVREVALRSSAPVGPIPWRELGTLVAARLRYALAADVA